MAKPDSLVPESDIEARRRKAQRARNVAIALALGAFVIILYVATWSKLGVNAVVRPTL
ncbi:MAG: hypothetical protein M9908_11085 [Phyllobacteriaceae bacterium]|nr:hypothetical protein [Phyllobacteriaceae bacterium]